MLKINRKNIVHVILGHSYLLFFLGLLLGLIIDSIFYFNFKITGFRTLGLFLIVVGPIIIFWAQRTSNKTREIRYAGISLCKDFAKGPYLFTRSPTHYGIFFMILGYGLIIGSLPVICMTFFMFIITKLFFLKAEEKILSEKYGVLYEEYKKKVKF